MDLNTAVRLLEEGQAQPTNTGIVHSREFISKRTKLFFMVFIGMCLHGIIQMNLVVENARYYDCAGGVINSAKEGYVTPFFLTTSLPQILFGRMSDVLGGRKVFGLSILIVSCVLVIFPAAVQSGIGNIEIDAMRMLMSFLLAPVHSATINIMTKWIPPSERGRFASNLFACSFGSAIFMLIPTKMIRQYGVGVMCYTSALFGFIWSIIWFTCISDSPLNHTRISDKEKNYIVESSMKAGTIYDSVSPQWIDMICTKQVWVIMSADALLTLASYFSSEPAIIMMIEKANAENQCWLYSISPIVTFLVSLISGLACDYFLSRGIVTVITARKTFTCFAAFATSIAHSALMLTGNGWTYKHVLIFEVTNGFIGTSSCGLELAFNDFAPNFAATLYGITACTSGLVAFIVMKIISSIDFKDTRAPLDELLCIAIAFSCSGGLLYLVFGKSELVRWNQHYVAPRSAMRDNRKTNHILVKRDSSYIRCL
ncbi:hypothetical protein LSTR_LSTR007866 [Laodelphax striatellus]|uniref:Major facilitator superfamily (MFS) profile domain-containing protein n=1 Tax=Laodelphax striatellus TaxID=195883 RepID=A0A482WNQ2_LAOST|nr:hypothetical protein LSTR_LSTR007866 [Laodelphax striatellus]